jgi:hypothetical protein
MHTAMAERHFWSARNSGIHRCYSNGDHHFSIAAAHPVSPSSGDNAADDRDDGCLPLALCVSLIASEAVSVGSPQKSTWRRNCGVTQMLTSTEMHQHVVQPTPISGARATNR